MPHAALAACSVRSKVASGLIMGAAELQCEGAVADAQEYKVPVRLRMGEMERLSDIYLLMIREKLDL